MERPSRHPPSSDLTGQRTLATTSRAAAGASAGHRHPAGFSTGPLRSVRSGIRRRGRLAPARTRLRRRAWAVGFALLAASAVLTARCSSRASLLRPSSPTPTAGVRARPAQPSGGLARPRGLPLGAGATNDEAGRPRGGYRPQVPLTAPGHHPSTGPRRSPGRPQRATGPRLMIAEGSSGRRSRPARPLSSAHARRATRRCRAARRAPIRRSPPPASARCRRARRCPAPARRRPCRAGTAGRRRS